MIFKFIRISIWMGAGLVLLIILVNLWVVLASKNRIFSQPDQVPDYQIALLLGTSERISTGQRNAFFDLRINAAVDLYQKGNIRKIIVSGDNSEQYYNETEAMKKALLRRGIPADVIVEDFAGFRTLDSMVRVKSVFDQDKVIVISQKFHIQRAIYIADAWGITAAGYIARDPAHRGPFFKVMAREYLARVKAFLDCYVLRTQPKFPGPKEPLRF